MSRPTSSQYVPYPLLLLALALMLLAMAQPSRADDYADVSKLMRSGQFANALVQIDAALQTRPRDPQMRFFKGTVERETGKPDQALATFTGLTEDYPELPEPYNNLAVIYALQNQLDKARTALEMALRINPQYATAHENLGDVYAKLAGQSYARALQLDAGNATLAPKIALLKETLVAKPASPSSSSAPAPATAIGTLAPAAPPAAKSP